MTVDQPAGVVPCGTDSGKVCVKGHGAFYGGVLARRVYVQIYQPPNAPPDPENGPPAGTAYCTPSSDGTWCMGNLAGAICANSPGPYPDNRAWVWGEFPNNGGFVYVLVSQPFQGRCQANLPPCVSGSSSGSSSA